MLNAPAGNRRTDVDISNEASLYATGCTRITVTLSLSGCIFCRLLYALSINKNR